MSVATKRPEDFPPQPVGDAAGPQILVVEEDATFRTMLEFLIEEAQPGARVAWASNSEEAEACLRSAGASLRIVVTDLFLSGGKTGLELWSAYHRADLAFLVISGAGWEQFRALVPQEALPPLFLEKPFDVDVCVETLRLLFAHPDWY